MKRNVACMLAVIALLAGAVRAADTLDPPQLDAAATVKEAQIDRLIVEDEDVGSYAVVADRQTVVEKNGSRIPFGDVKVGDRVVVEPRSEPPEGRAGRTIEAARIVVLLEIAH
jgi:hypothetical protein